MSADMSLRSLADRPTTRPDHTCGACWVHDLLETTEAAFLDAALANKGVTAVEIETALDAMGYDVSAETIRRHRRGACKRAAK